MTFSLRRLVLATGCLLLAGNALAAEPKRPECIAPASPGGGFDLTCKLVQSALVQEKILSKPMRVTYMPGGVGAVAYNAVVAQRPADAGTLVAWSSGSLLNLAQGKFGRFDETNVRWLREQGVTRVLAVPGMLFAAGHAKNDIPSVLNTYQAQNPGMVVNYGRELGIDLKMIRAAGDRIQAAVDEANETLGFVEKHDTLLMVVGRGSSDPDANSNATKVMRMLWEGMGFGWCETGYSGVTFPLVEPGLTHAAKLGYKRIIVFPYFLFTGVLVKRIYSYTDEVAARHPELVDRVGLLALSRGGIPCVQPPTKWL